MGIFSNILAKIFPSDHPAITTAPTDVAAASGTASTTATAPAPAPAPGVAGAPVLPEVDVIKVLEDMSTRSTEKLNWRTSIVDLMKLLGLDSSLPARKALAAELHYAGNTDDSATMNIWLHKQVMTKLAQNGGKVPADLKD